LADVDAPTADGGADDLELAAQTPTSRSTAVLGCALRRLMEPIL